MAQTRARKSLAFRETSTERTTIVGGKTVTEKTRNREIVLPNKATSGLAVASILLVVFLARDELQNLVANIFALF